MAGQTVVITGAGRGLGFAMAVRVGSAGARVYVAELNRDRGLEAVGDLVRQGFDAHFVEMDVTDSVSVGRAADAILSHGPVDALVNNAALADGVGGKAFHLVTEAEWDRVMRTNATGPWLVSKAFAPAMIERRYGRIVNVASDAALYGSPRLAHYVASKGALIALTRAMARELGPHGITVNAVAPGLSRTESAEAIPKDRHDLYSRNRVIDRDQQPEDTAGLVAFLAGSEAGYITGQLVVVDGGFVFH